MLTLAIGDFYIPERAIDLPSKFRKLLCPNPNSYPSNNKISQVICLGNITNSNETLKFLYNLSPSLNLVRGEFDDLQLLSHQLLSLSNVESPIPLYQTVTHGNLKIGITNGYQVVPKNDPLSLSALARELDVDILVWGGTHKVEAYTLDGKFFVNPGSATGAYSFDWPDNEEEDEEKEDESKQKEEYSKEKKEEKLTDAEVLQAGHSDQKSEEKKEEMKEDKLNDTNDEINEEDLNEITESTTSIPSFCLLDTHDSTCTLYIYTYLNGEIKVDKVTYHKE